MTKRAFFLTEEFCLDRNDGNKREQGRLFYDGECPLCRGLKDRWGGLLARYGFAVEPLQAPGVTARTGLPMDRLMEQMNMLTDDGRVLAGVDAFAFIASRIWWARPLALAARLPGVLPLLRRVYAWVAQNRYCLSGACSLQRPKSRGWLPLAGLAALAIGFGPYLPAWAFMWLLSVAGFAGLKWWTLAEGFQGGLEITWPKALGYLLLWPGMDPQPFGMRAPRAEAPRPGEWAAAWGKTGSGALLLWMIARRCTALGGLAVGWTGMVGLSLLLHFGAFHLVSLAWRAAGVDAAPIMRSPLRARSLADFWGARWNLAFSRLGRELVIKRLLGTWSARDAGLLVFLISGLVHEAVISVPARAGYGLPTAYFLLQGAGVRFEGSRLGRAFGVGRGNRARAFALLAAALPAVFLFHPAFVRVVFIPFMEVIGAL
ncbi:MAG: DUF393 domain-containing protein [Proteobacteria bacterium]|nr:DUF393 domain-containing protein [Pseudomonadota bacterium]